MKVETSGLTAITLNSAISGGEILSDGNCQITGCGVCWDTIGSPTLTDNMGFANNGVCADSFQSSISNLDENTVYYVVAYSTNEVGVSYGSTVSFTTLELKFANVITDTPTAVTITKQLLK